MPPPHGLAVLYEHPEWFRPLFAELDRRGLPVLRVPAERMLWDPEASDLPRLVVNRMSPSAHQRGHGNGLFAVQSYLAHLEARGVAVVNGSRAFRVETSKARQLDLFRQVGVRYPRSRVINHPSRAVEAAQGLRFPLVVKANIGGSGAGITRYSSLEELGAADVALGMDSVALVQEFLPARGGAITRIEVLDGRFLYAIRIHTDQSQFNLCPADICQPASDSHCPAEGPTRGLRVERTDPPREAVEAALALARAAHLDVGGLEYLVDDRTGEVNFYDVNALSNFVANAVEVVGFDPTARFVDYLEKRLG